MSPTLRVLVVEDSLTVRRRIVEILSSTPGFEVVGEAEDGEAAIALCETLRPDVITMDMILPGLSGLAATEHIMAFFPTPILIVSASINRGELFQTYEALAAGAVDVLDKPGEHDAGPGWERRLVDAVRMVARIRVITHPRARLGLAGRGPRPRVPLIPTKQPRSLIAIGASTGGPGALLKILEAFPATFEIPILLVLHISQTFGEAMTQWLDSRVPLGVRYARDGEDIPTPGQCGVLMAPPGLHLQVSGGKVRLTDGPERHYCRPSIDVLFESIAAEVGTRAVGCLLTGMGRDGARGLLAMREAGALTIAQDEATSIVYGMPAEAARLGAAELVLGLPDIGPALRHAVVPEERK